MSAVVRKMVPAEKPGDVRQYWLCLKVEADRQGIHTYFLEDGMYAVTGYICKEADAVRMCSAGKCVAEVIVHNYLSAELLAHKKEFTFLRWVLIRPVKAPA